MISKYFDTFYIIQNFYNLSEVQIIKIMSIVPQHTSKVVLKEHIDRHLILFKY